METTQAIINAILADEVFIKAVASIVGVIFLILSRRAVKAIESFTGIKADEKHLIAFHEAVVTGVESAMHNGLDDSLSTMRAHVVQHLKESVPEALAALAPGDGVIDQLAVSLRRSGAGEIGAVDREV